MSPVTMPLPPLSADDIRKYVQKIVDEGISGVRLKVSESSRREDSLLWAMRFYEGASGIEPDDVVVAAKAFESYVYGGAQ